jgi:hypothetical protein
LLRRFRDFMENFLKYIPKLFPIHHFIFFLPNSGKIIKFCFVIRLFNHETKMFWKEKVLSKKWEKMKEMKCWFQQYMFNKRTSQTKNVEGCVLSSLNTQKRGKDMKIDHIRQKFHSFLQHLTYRFIGCFSFWNWGTTQKYTFGIQLTNQYRNKTEISC